MNRAKQMAEPEIRMADDHRLRLQRWWRSAVMVCLLILLGGFLILNYGQPHRHVWQWMTQAAVVTAYVLCLLKIGLPMNHRAGQNALFADLGWGTWLTLTRAMLIANLAGYIFQPWPASRIFSGRLSFTPGGLYIAACILDYFDGRVARRSNHQSRLGEYLDVNIDALGLLIAPLLAVWYGRLPAAYLSVGAAYYLFVAGIRLRKMFSKPVFELKPRRGARIIAGLQMGFVGVTLLPVFSPRLTTVAAYIFMTPLLAGFIRDWLFVCGCLPSGSFLKTIRRRRFKSYLT